MKLACVLPLFAVASIAFAQAPEIVVPLATGGAVSGRIVGLYREGAMIEDPSGRTSLVRWEDLPSLGAQGEPAPVAAASPAPASPAAGRGQASAPPDDACCKPKTPLCPKPLKGKVALSGTVRSGNVDSVLGAFHAEATKDWEEDKLFAAIDALYGKTDGTLTAASLGGKTRWDHFFTPTFYGYASAEALYDDIQNLDLRAITSIGAGDFIWKQSEDCSWAVEGGLSGLYEDYETREPDFSLAARAATIYKRILFTDLKLEQGLELLVPIDDPGRYLARSKTLLGVPLCKDLALRLSLEITYQGDPPTGTQALDILGLVGIEYQF
jgi:hypothetical protein